MTEWVFLTLDSSSVVTSVPMVQLVAYLSRYHDCFTYLDLIK